MGRVGAGRDGLGSWVVLQVVTTVFRDDYQITDTFLMPVIGLLLTVIAAVVNVLAVWRGQHARRSTSWRCSAR